MLSLWVWWTHVSVAIYWSSKDANMDPGKIACSNVSVTCHALDCIKLVESIK